MTGFAATMAPTMVDAFVCLALFVRFRFVCAVPLPLSESVLVFG